MSSLPPKQLSMVIDRDAVDRLPDVLLPDGYLVRGYMPGDIPSWSNTLQAGGFTDWSEERVYDYLVDDERREGSRVIEYDDLIVAGTFASQITVVPRPASRRGSDRDREGVLDFVVTHPDHRSKGLGRATCTEVAKFLISRGYEAISLSTDDWRLPAIHVYLSLGFRPVMHREDMPGRWATIYEKLKEAGHDYA